MRNIKSFFKIILLISLALALFNCGKYGKPRPPEEFAPAEVNDLAVTASVQGVTFNWRAPEDNARGKKLEDLEGYRVYRRELGQAANLSDPNAKFDLIATIEDTHLKELIAQRKEAIDQGQLTRNVSLPEERYKFQYIDHAVTPGKRYYYQIVPINQGGVEGKVVMRVDVLFRGEVSEIARIPYAAEEFEF